jgi:hypothetical protein
MNITKPITKTIEMDPATESNKFTHEQIDRIMVTINKLAKRTTNAQAITLAHNLNASNSYDEKRKWITLFYIGCFQLLSFINMAKAERFDSYTEEEFEQELKMLFKEVT